MLMEGRGEMLSPVRLNLEGLYLVLLFPGIHVSTAEAYRGVKPRIPEDLLAECIHQPVSKWEGLVSNDFERSVFAKHPGLKDLKQQLYQSGAVYASMSGSGSSIYGFFEKPPSLPAEVSKQVIWEGLM
jgi:4-diphosphocytidyl-2-C-methyl-D-erythritol kinase